MHYSSMLQKKELIGKFVTFKDSDGKWRTNKVVKVYSSYITVKDAVGTKRRIHKDKVMCRQFRKRGTEEIKW